MLNNLYHLKWVRALRSFARDTGVLKILKKILSRRQDPYEEAFHAALRNSVAFGDVVWDIGANVGLYTQYFLEWTGSEGHVIAFEPLPQAYSALSANLIDHPQKKQVQLIQAALADKAGEAVFAGKVSDDSITTTAHIIESGSRNSSDIIVKVSTVDDELAQGIKPPNVVKIDVEGFEEDVLRGGEKTFSSKTCKHILVEMHFTRMDERKLGDSANRIVRMLKNWGYSVNWVDPSHLRASR